MSNQYFEIFLGICAVSHKVGEFVNLEWFGRFKKYGKFYMPPRVNELLAQLPDNEYQVLKPHLELVSLPKGRDLFQMGDDPSHVYYPVGAVVSVMKDMSDGFSVETYMLGKSSLVGHCAFVGPSFYRANVRTSGLAYRIPVPILRRLLPMCPAHTDAVMRSMGRVVAQLSQSIVCSKHHSVEKQLMRWMLVTLDRTLEPEIQMTHQEISERLGFRREAITLALGKLMERGHIQIRRGTMEIINRQALEAQVCDCYWIAQEKTKPRFDLGWGEQAVFKGALDKGAGLDARVTPR